MRRGSSRRLTRCPTSFGRTGDVAMDYLCLPFPDGVLNRVDDVLITGAAAEIAGDPLTDLALGRLRVVLQQSDRRHDHPGRAETALQPVFFPEAFLQRVQLAVRGEPLDRRDGRSVGLHREERAGLRAAAVDENGAGAALCGVAADVRAGQAQLFAEEVDEQDARVDLPLADLAINGHRNLSHRSVLCAWETRTRLLQNADDART